MKDKLKQLKACDKAREWAANKTAQELFDTCPRGDWMLWLFRRTNPDDLQRLTLAKAHCANTVRHLMTDERSLKAVDVAIAFGEGRATREELDAAAAAADAATDAAYAGDAAAYAGDAAAYAAYAADDAAYVAAYVAAAAADAAAAAADVAADAAYVKKENQKLTADICRKYLPFEIWNI